MADADVIQGLRAELLGERIFGILMCVAVMVLMFALVVTSAGMGYLTFKEGMVEEMDLSFQGHNCSFGNVSFGELRASYRNVAYDSADFVFMQNYLGGACEGVDVAIDVHPWDLFGPYRYHE